MQCIRYHSSSYDDQSRRHDSPIYRGPGDEGELQPMRAMACWATLSSGLNYYIGKNNWSYDANGQPYADGFKITVYDNGTCRVTGDDVSYSFRFSTYD